MNAPRLRPRLADASWLTDRILIGASLRQGEGTATQRLAELVTDHGLTHILDCRSEAHDRYLIEDHAPGVQYMRCGLPDDGDAASDQWFARGLAMATDALAEPDAVLLIHCSNGQTRGPSMAFAVLLDMGQDPVDALRAVLRARPVARAEYANLALSWYLRRDGADEATRDAATARLARAREGTRSPVL